MSFEIKPATRQGMKVLCGLYGKSGSGKTMSALLFARGLVGPSGRITLIDSESGRGSIFADIIPGGYSVIDLEPLFSPERYQEAFEVAEQNSDVIIIDSLSHAHAGEGGVLDMQEAELDRMAGDNWTKREQCKMASWIKPKMVHKRFVQRILRSKVPLVCCLRGEEKTHAIKDANNKTKVVTDEFSTPIFDPRFIFELLVNFETLQRNGKGGYVIPRKITHPAIEEFLPSEGEQLGIKHGELIAKWANAGAISGPQKPASESTPEKERALLKKRIWDRAKPYYGTLEELEGWLYNGGLLNDGESLKNLPVQRLEVICDEVEASLEAKF